MSNAPARKTIRTAVEALRREQRRFLAELVEINSFTGHKEGVDRVGERVTTALEALGLDHRRFPHPEVGDLHRFDAVPLGASEDVHRLVLLGHLDTVFPADSGFDTFSEDPAPVEADGSTRYRGPGVMDMKGGIAVIVFALRALAEAGLDIRRLPVSLLFDTDEEQGSLESGPWVREQARGAAGALVFEGGRDGDAVVTARKGSGRMRVRTTGRGAHAGNRHRDGVNAVVQMAHVCIALEALTDYGRELTVNVGVVRGGSAKNVVPDAAEALVDFRYLEPADADRLREKVRKIAATAYLDGASTEIELVVARPPMPRSPASLELLERYAAAARGAGIESQEAPLQGGGSDANLVADEGIPVIDGLGPFGRGFHTHDEWISAESLIRKTQALALFLADWTR